MIAAGWVLDMLSISFQALPPSGMAAAIRSTEEVRSNFIGKGKERSSQYSQEKVQNCGMEAA
jgi:hypothetical protein